ncbi:vascular cell adhesion protein 1 [Tympanuchus pallidicinctus]|uniref:vascular cell adhesion protein 1 n=1 Tax=Tympanuchus pallidicinctus TaxID=109042 RepID=UPI0022875AFC|nr:vascular cell adhesion protein 1 [Tympanuchus pallidicinctus]
MLKQMGRTSQTVLIILYVLITVKAFEMEVIPADRVVAQIGETLILTCNTTGCALPKFSWRTQMDYPLGGKVYNDKTYSTLTMSPVSAENNNDYLCTVICNKEKKEKSVKVELYSFPSDPVIKTTASLVVGETATVICKVHDVFPSDHLELLLKKEEHILHSKTFEGDVCTKAETKTVAYSFNLTTEDNGKEITCVARLQIAGMDFEPNERSTSLKLNANFGPQNTFISASPGNLSMEGHSLKLTCVTESNPPAQVFWRKHLAKETIQHFVENNVLSIPHAHFTDSGQYICEVINPVTNKTEKATVNIVIQAPPKNTTLTVFPSSSVKEGESVTISCTATGVPAVQIILEKKIGGVITTLKAEDGKYTIEKAELKDAGKYECTFTNKFGNRSLDVELDVKVPPQNITVLVYPSENVKEGENITIVCSTYSNPPSQMILKKVNQEKEIILPVANGTFTLYNVTKNDTGRYVLDVFNEVGSNIKVIEIAVVGKLEKPDQIMPLIIAFSCVTAVAIPVVAILIYVSRKAKINGSYSLVKALRLKV